MTTDPFLYFIFGIVMTVTFKMLHTFLLKRTIVIILYRSKRYTTTKFCPGKDSKGKD